MKQKAKILILDDDNYVLLSLRILIEQHYTDVRGINNPAQLETALQENDFDVVVLDMNFMAGDTSGRDGLKYLRQIKEANPTGSVYMSFEVLNVNARRNSFHAARKLNKAVTAIAGVDNGKTTFVNT